MRCSDRWRWSCCARSALLPGRARCLVVHPANPPHLLPIVELGFGTVVLVVNADLPAKSVRELIALAKAKPGVLTYATTGSLLSGWLAHGQRLLVFNRCMAAALVLTAVWMLWSVR